MDLQAVASVVSLVHKKLRTHHTPPRLRRQTSRF